MSASYESINYSLRPAKAIERKMLGEAMRCLSVFRELRSYRYIGLGSTYFSDFQLFHRSLDLVDMVSIERDVGKSQRFEFNKPYDCIRINFKEAKHAIPEEVLDYLPAIVWLDYDDPLNADILADLRATTTLLPAGSMLIYSINAHPTKDPETRIDLLRQALGDDRVPTDIENKHLSSWGTASVYRRIAHNEILEALTAKNAPRPMAAKIEYRQIFHFHYADGAKMLTAGGMLLDTGMTSNFHASGLDRLPFFRGGSDPYEIRVPSLTYREIRHLDKALPGTVMPDTLGIPNDDLDMYRRIYRYFPNFSEVH